MKREASYDEQSDWNMGVMFYQQLAYLKERYIFYVDQRELKLAIQTLNQEIDWVNFDLGKDNLKTFRSRIDGLANQSRNNLSDSQRDNLFRNLNLLKRDVWDVQNKNNITRPKNNIDLSGVPMAIVNGR